MSGSVAQNLRIFVVVPRLFALVYLRPLFEYESINQNLVAMVLLLLLAGVRVLLALHGGAFDIRHTVGQFVRCCCLFQATTRIYMIGREAFIRIIIEGNFRGCKFRVMAREPSEEIFAVVIFKSQVNSRAVYTCYLV